MAVAYEDATLAKYKEIRGEFDAHMFKDVIANPSMRVIIQIAFEAGRQWQSEHPTADVTFPDYDAPKVP
jgi:hypothetical protein